MILFPSFTLISFHITFLNNYPLSHWSFFSFLNIPSLFLLHGPLHTVPQFRTLSPSPLPGWFISPFLWSQIKVIYSEKPSLSTNILHPQLSSTSLCFLSSVQIAVYLSLFLVFVPLFEHKLYGNLALLRSPMPGTVPGQKRVSIEWICQKCPSQYFAYRSATGFGSSWSNK